MLKPNEVLEDLYEDKKIIQNKELYRFTSDSILLSRFVKAKKGDVVADFCAGCGVVGFHFLCLNPQITSLTCFELQHSLADMAERTAKMNAFEDVKIVEGRLQDVPNEYNDKFSLILCNPPYEKGGFENDTYEKAICRKELTITMEEIVEVAKKKLKFGGRLAMIQRADRIAELFYCLKKRGLEPKKMQFVSGTIQSSPYLVMVEAVKGGREGITVLPTQINVR
jgi:tRNA1(Val) A37 N6-methylase TrmN6